MIKKLHSVVIWTEEMGRLVPFYRDVLGLQQEMDTPEFAVFASEDGPQLAIGTHSEVHGRSGDPYRVMVDFQVDDCLAEYERLKGQGVEFIRSPSQDEGAIIATLSDPDGNLLQLFQMT